MLDRSLSSSSSVSAFKMVEERRRRKCLPQTAAEDDGYCFHSGQNHRRRRRIKWAGPLAAPTALGLALLALSATAAAVTAEDVDDDVYSVVSGAAHLGRRSKTLGAVLYP